MIFSPLNCSVRMSPYERMVILTPAIVVKMVVVTLLTDLIVFNLRRYYRLTEWWAIVDSNHRPQSYQDCALTN